MTIQNLKTIVTKKELVANKTYQVRFSLQDDKTLSFDPGQFVNILVAPSIRRSYSISSSVLKNSSVETIANAVAGGPGSKFFENVKVGDKVEMLGPLGTFVYRHSEDKPVYFFSTGTGLTPYLSMIDYALEKIKTKRKITAYAGFRFEEDVFAKDYLDDLAKKFDNLNVVYTLSKPSSSWQGKSGRITKLIASIKDTDFDAYICGSQLMIKDVEELLEAVPEDEVGDLDATDLPHVEEVTETLDRDAKDVEESEVEIADDIEPQALETEEQEVIDEASGVEGSESSEQAEDDTNLLDELFTILPDDIDFDESEDDDFEDVEGDKKGKKKKRKRKKFIEVEYDPEADIVLAHKKRKRSDSDWEEKW